MPDSELHLSAVAIGEIQAGIELTQEQDSAKAAEIAAWADLVATVYNLLPMDGATFQTWAWLMHRKSNTFYEDAMIAVTAIVNNLTIVTRNIVEFKHVDVKP